MIHYFVWHNCDGQRSSYLYADSSGFFFSLFLYSFFLSVFGQAQQWDTEREARDKIESDLRRQIANYEKIVQANEKKYAHFDPQLQQKLTDQLRIAEQKNVILMEENQKHVTDFEHFKAQLEFHKSVASTSAQHSSSSSSSSNHFNTSHVFQETDVQHSETTQDRENKNIEAGGEFHHLPDVETDAHPEKHSVTHETERDLDLNQALQTEVRRTTEPVFFVW